jgi:hypothetical protein
MSGDLESKKVLVKQLLCAKKDIESVLRRHRDAIDALQSNRAYSIDDVLKFANSITQTVRAPKDWAPGLPLSGHPPAPLSEQIRAGALERYTLRCKSEEEKKLNSNAVTIAQPTNLAPSNSSNSSVISVPPILTNNSSAAMVTLDVSSSENLVLAGVSEDPPSKRIRSENLPDAVQGNIGGSAIQLERPERPVDNVQGSNTTGDSENLTVSKSGAVEDDMDTEVDPPSVPVKVQRNISISFGFSDSENSSDSDSS